MHTLQEKETGVQVGGKGQVRGKGVDAEQEEVAGSEWSGELVCVKDDEELTTECMLGQVYELSQILDIKTCT